MKRPTVLRAVALVTKRIAEDSSAALPLGCSVRRGVSLEGVEHRRRNERSALEDLLDCVDLTQHGPLADLPCHLST